MAMTVLAILLFNARLFLLLLLVLLPQWRGILVCQEKTHRLQKISSKAMNIRSGMCWMR